MEQGDPSAEKRVGSLERGDFTSLLRVESVLNITCTSNAPLTAQRGVDEGKGKRRNNKAGNRS